MELQPVPFNMEAVFAKRKKKKRKKQIKKLYGQNSPLYKATWPMIYVIQVFGYAPYNLSQDRLMPSNNMLFTVIAIILYTYIFCVVFVSYLNIKRESRTLDGTETTKVVMNYSILLYELGLAVFTRRSFVRIWNALQDYDEEIRQLGYPRKETRTAIGAWIVVIVCTVTWIAINHTGMYAFTENWTYNVGYMLLYISTSMALYKFVAVAIFLGQRFQHLNTIAKKNLPSVEGRESAISKKTILDLHNDLMITAENLESLYSWSLLFWLGNLTLHTISNIYFIIQWIIIKQWNVISWGLVSCLSLWSLAFFIQLLLLHVACDFASFQANCFGAIMVEWQARQMKKTDQESVELLLQFLNRRLKFSAGGCFYVNLSLLRSIASLTTTYLVILLQFNERTPTIK
ncbi:uncharacterized protein LOC105196034 [Solenopsis invicta]|uniref:uncharacterized protein LOC105196034 n=1 Tax=Solenopsis invicta TaxID=13686 RepID=UPI00193D5A3B|nr:uncharacterized protein LOC105196034 [Solenopsis invicta]